MPETYESRAMNPTITTSGELTADEPPGAPAYDVTVVGAGVVGTAIARELARYRLRTALLDASDDIGNGTSKANTAILHTGFDAVPGTLEARLVREGQHQLRAYAAETGIPVERVGALLVAWDEEQLAALPALSAKAERNEYHAARLLDADELRAREPRLGPGALGALEIPDESIICPWTTPLAYATQAVRAGVHLHLNCRVRHIDGGDDVHTLTTTRSCAPAISSTPPDCTPTRSTGNSATTTSPSPRAGASSSSSTSSPATW